MDPFPVTLTVDGETFDVGEAVPDEESNFTLETVVPLDAPDGVAEISTPIDYADTREASLTIGAAD